MARQILGERQFDTEVDSWLRETRQCLCRNQRSNLALKNKVKK
jgi:hypothetical protein